MLRSLGNRSAVVALAALIGSQAARLLAAADSAAEPVDFERQIAPLLIRNCLGCHNANDPSGGLSLSTAEAAAAGGESGSPALAPGSPDDSYLLARAAEGEMPPPGKGPRLLDAEVLQLRAWIAAGAPWPERRELSVLEFTTDKRGGRDFWSLRPPVRPPLPAVRHTGWVRTPIDAFVMARLEAVRLSPAPPADRATLIRRLYLDLHGLPPTPEEVQAFLADPAPDAYERLVDRLLASPRYGERWARHWLDVVRFAESQGYETNVARPNAWPYRDYVVAAFNDDRPYPQFILEQLAGDQVGVEVATGFLVGGPHDVVSSPDPELTAQQRLNDLDDMASTIGLAFLGLTVGCAKCHDHKFDPLTQQDYYALHAALAGVQHGEREVRPMLSAAERRDADELERQLESARAAQAALVAEFEPLAHPGTGAGGVPVDARRPAVHALGNVERFAATPARYVRFTVLATNQLEPCLDELEVFTAETPPGNVALAAAGALATASSVYEDGNSPIHRLEHVHDGRYGNGRSWISKEPGAGWVQIELPQTVAIERIAWARDREGVYSDRLPIRYRIETAVEPGQWQTVADGDDRAPYDPAAAKTELSPAALPAAARARYEQLDGAIQSLRARLAPALPRQIYAGLFVAPAPTFRLHRGEPLARREPILPGGIASIGPAWQLTADASDAQRRLALARWLGSPDNPLTARVMVNRLWHYHFGRGLVQTPGDFGFGGERPSHAELLDWLATQFVADAWRPKAIHRLIVLSSAYRQSSATNPQAAALDGDSRLLWRFPPHRLEAEPIRDAMLAVSGALDLAMGGPGFDVFEPNSNYVKVYTPKRSFGPADWRRMIYQQQPRMRHDDVFGSFDCPDAAGSTPRRNVSTTALQSLSLLNGAFVVEQAQLFAARLAREAPDDAAAQVRRGFWLAFGREPTEEERAAGCKLATEAGLAVVCRALLNANEFLFVR